MKRWEITIFLGQISLFTLFWQRFTIEKHPKHQFFEGFFAELAQVAAPVAAQAQVAAPVRGAEGGEGLDGPERLVAVQLAAAAEITRMEAESWRNGVVLGGVFLGKLRGLYHLYLSESISISISQTINLCLKLYLYLSICPSNPIQSHPS